MSYLPDNPTRERQPELYQPILFPRSGVTRTGPRSVGWSNHAFWGTVVFLGCAGALLLAWGAYVGAPHRGNTEKLLQAQQAVPKLKGEATTAQALVAAPIQVASAEPPPMLVAPAPMPVEFPAFPMVELPPPPEPFKIEPPPAPEPLKIETPMAPALPVKIETPAVFPPPPAPMKIEPPVVPPLPVEVVQPLLDQQQESPIFLGRANPGETPMIRTWKTLALYSLLAVTPVVAPTPAVAAGGGADEKLQKRIDDMLSLMGEAIKSMNSVSQGIGEVRKDVKTVQTDVENLKGVAVKLRTDVDSSATRIEDLNKLIGNLQADVSFLQRQLAKQVTSGNGSALDKAALEELKKQLVSIEQAILKLRPAEPTTSRIALSPPAATGRVILANMYHEEMLFLLNQKAHRVAPGTVVTVDSVPAGMLTYEAISPSWGLVRPRTNHNLPANETLTLTAR